MIWTDKIYVFDNIIDLSLQEEIKKLFLNNTFAWYYVNDITNPKNKQQRPGFQHNFLIDGKVNSNFYDLVLPIAINSCKKINYNMTKVSLCRSFLQLPLNLKTKEFDKPHIDSKEHHLVALYYVKDSDGETVIFKNTYKKEKDFSNIKFKKNKKIMPKQGTVVLFDGFFWHTSHQPKKNVRCVINFNLI
jgi:hypothetical protein